MRIGRSLAFLVLLAPAGGFAQFRAGAAKRVITPDLSAGPVYMAGFGRNRVATGVHDDLYARCLALAASPAARPLVLCGVDSIGLFVEDVEKIRDAAAEKLGRPADIVVAALHDHEAPDTMGLWGPNLTTSGINDQYNLFVIERTAEAAVDAVHLMQPATARLATVRDPSLDAMIHDNRPPVVHDASLVVLWVGGAKRQTIATLVNWANHPETLGSQNKLITADYSGYLYKALEKKLGGMAVFLNGAVGGMQSPLGAKVDDAPDETYQKAELIGTRLATLAAKAATSAKPVRIESIEFKETPVTIPVTNQWYLMAARAGVFKGRKPMGEDHTTKTLVGMFRLSGAAGKPLLQAALIPGELYPELSVGGVTRYPGADYPDAPAEPPIKKAMRAPYRMLIGLADDEIGYIIPKAEWDEKPPWLQNAPKRWYGEINSVGPEAAPIIVETAEKLLNAGHSQ